jgi:aminoglycoside phosphotransferase
VVWVFFTSLYPLRNAVLIENPGVHKLLVEALANRHPVFVVNGTLKRLCELFGVDPQTSLQVMESSSGLAMSFGSVTGADVVVHVALTEDRKNALRWLRAGSLLGKTAVGHLAPDIVAVNESRLIVTRLAGRPVEPWAVSERALQNAILTALDTLKLIHSCGPGNSPPDIALIARIESFVAAHPRRYELHPVLKFICDWDRSSIRSVIVHGDYWLSNILFSDNTVTGVVDWDRARRDGCAAFDALHLGFISYAAWADLCVSDVLADLWSGRWRFPWLAHYCRMVCQIFSVSPADLERIAALLWLSWFDPAITPRSPSWESKMITPVAHAIEVSRATCANIGISVSI